MFGNWTEQIDRLSIDFGKAIPFPHVVIDDFLDEVTANQVCAEFPRPDETWWCYDNPIEKKYSKDRLSPLQTPTIASVFEFLQDEKTIDLIRKITGIHNLENDPYLHGAGLHYHPRGGKLDIHLDYSIHPLSQKERRLNLILYMNRDWHPEFGGHLELWNEEFTGPKQCLLPKYNRAVLFQTSDISYHGMPHPISCPPNEGRKSLAIYYVSPARPNATIRYKAAYRPLPNQEVSPGMKRLYEIRKMRVLTQDDVQTHCPEFVEKRESKK